MKVAQNEAGIRLDLFLKTHVPDLTRKQAKRLLDQGLVRVGKRKVIIASWELQAGDVVTISESATATDDDPAAHFLKVVFEDPHLIVVEKAAGIRCESSPLALRPSLVEVVNAYLQKQAAPGSRPYLGLMHRLDQETSGLMVYTKKKAANSLAQQFKHHEIDRKYLTLVVGAVEKTQGVIETDLVKEDQPGGRKVKITAKGKGQRAKTQYRVLERYAKLTLLEVTVRTGRTHQIRVHLASIGYPLVGDRLYGAKATSISLKRHALHAAYLSFRHPVTDKVMEFSSELPRDLRRVLDRLRRRA